MDPLLRTARVLIRNPRFVEWTGTSFTFTSAAPAWVNPNRHVIAADDPRAADADFVWDSLTLEWAHDLAECRLDAVRQYVHLRTVPSGLRGTR